MSGSTVANRGGVLLLAPMASELRPLVRLLGARRDPEAPGPLYRPKRGERPVAAAQLGVGPVQARRNAEAFTEALVPELTVVVGIAGGLAPQLAVGDAVIPATVLDLDHGREYVPQYLPRHDREGILATSAEFIVDEERLDPLRRRGVVAMDMETAAVAEVCEARGLRWSVVRVISDRPEDGLLDPGVVALLRPDGSVDAAAALRYLLTHPRRLPRLARWGRDAKLAARRAAEQAVAIATH